MESDYTQGFLYFRSGMVLTNITNKRKMAEPEPSMPSEDHKMGKPFFLHSVLLFMAVF